MSNKIVEVLPPSWMSIYTETMYDDEILAVCTSFTVEYDGEYYLITNRHNLTGRHNDTGKCLSMSCAIPNKIRIHLNKKGELGNIIPVEIKILDDDDNPIWLEHPEFSRKVDVVAIRLNGEYEKIEWTPYPIKSDFDIKVQPSDYLSVVGFPFKEAQLQKLAIWATGFMASDYEVNYRDLPLFLIDCRTRQGQSGSPVIICRNSGVYIGADGKSKILAGTKFKLLGIYSGRIREEADLGLVWKAKVIEEIIGFRDT